MTRWMVTTCVFSPWVPSIIYMDSFWFPMPAKTASDLSHTLQWAILSPNIWQHILSMQFVVWLPTCDTRWCSNLASLHTWCQGDCAVLLHYLNSGLGIKMKWEEMYREHLDENIIFNGGQFSSLDELLDEEPLRFPSIDNLSFSSAISEKMVQMNKNILLINRWGRGGGSLQAEYLQNLHLWI